MFRRFPTSPAWVEMQRIQREMNRAQGLDCFPMVNVYANEQAELVSVELPGAQPEDLQINVAGETLTISGVRAAEPAAEEAEYHRQERTCGKFTRSLELLFPVDGDKVEATYENGVLTVRLPRAEADKPRKIAVKTA